MGNVVWVVDSGGNLWGRECLECGVRSGQRSRSRGSWTTITEPLMDLVQHFFKKKTKSILLAFFLLYQRHSILFFSRNFKTRGFKEVTNDFGFKKTNSHHLPLLFFVFSTISKNRKSWKGLYRNLPELNLSSLPYPQRLDYNCKYCECNFVHPIIRKLFATPETMLLFCRCWCSCNWWKHSTIMWLKSEYNWDTSNKILRSPLLTELVQFVHKMRQFYCHLILIHKF